MRMLMVGGVFDLEGGRKSGYFEKLAKGLKERIDSANFHAHSRDVVESVNGGSYALLDAVMGQVGGFDHLFWGADVPNELPKLLPQIMAKYPDLVLIQTKNNREGKYTTEQLVGRMADSSAKYLVEFTQMGDQIGAQVINAKGNALNVRTAQIHDIVLVLEVLKGVSK